MGVEDLRVILDRLHDTKSALETIVSCDILRHIDFVGVLDRQPTKGVPRVDDCGGDRQTWNSKVCAETRDTRFIQVRAAVVVNPMSCLGIKYGALRLVLVE
jgi:hypothetical protein